MHRLLRFPAARRRPSASSAGLLLLCLSPLPALAQKPPPPSPAAGAPAATGAAPIDPGHAHEGQMLETDPGRKDRLSWWSEARFGMFIHWGLYAQDGCHWKGQDGKTEHMMRHLKIPLRDYAKIAEDFNPVKFDADAWVRTAKAAGMKYLVITSKHHDGFAMWGSKSSDYNIVARTPWKRDPLQELAAACKRHGLRFGVYYSLGRDWQDPDVPTRDGYRSNSWDYPDESKKDFSRYFERKVKPQVRELLTGYGPIAVMWFDTPETISRPQSEELVTLIRSLQPATIINSRVGNRLGDYAVNEQKVPDAAGPQPWETCMTLNGHWGYHKRDDRWKSPETLVRTLVDVASKGGNFLLNVGPTGEGVIPAPSVERLGEVGRWMKVNGPAIHGTTSCAVGPLAFGRCTQKSTRTGTELYLHVFDWPADGQLPLPPLPGQLRAARLLSNGKRLSVRETSDGLRLTVPTDRPDPWSSTIRLQLREAPAKSKD